MRKGVTLSFAAARSRKLRKNHSTRGGERHDMVAKIVSADIARMSMAASRRAVSLIRERGRCAVLLKRSYCVAAAGLGCWKPDDVIGWC